MAEALRLGAAIFNGDHGRLAEEVSRVEEAGVDFIHFDVFDGQFVPSMGQPPRTLRDLRRVTTLPFEVHLGVRNPEVFFPELVEAGASLILVHSECLSMPYEQLLSFREYGSVVGVAIALGSPVASLVPIIGLVNAILVLTRAVGENVSGARFDPRGLERTREAAHLAASENPMIDIQVAGGVRRPHAGDLVHAGAKTIVLGRTIFESEDMAEAVSSFRELGDRSDVSRGGT